MQQQHWLCAPDSTIQSLHTPLANMEANTPEMKYTKWTRPGVARLPVWQFILNKKHIHSTVTSNRNHYTNL